MAGQEDRTAPGRKGQVAMSAHNPEVAGSNPAPATESGRLSGRPDYFYRLFYRRVVGRTLTLRRRS